MSLSLSVYLKDAATWQRLIGWNFLKIFLCQIGGLTVDKTVGFGRFSHPLNRNQNRNCTDQFPTGFQTDGFGFRFGPYGSG